MNESTRRGRRDSLQRRIAWERVHVDPAGNVSTAPPAGEKVALRRVWTAEVYPPSRAGVLLEGLRRLGGEPSEYLFLDPVFAIQWSRERKANMAYPTDLGMIVRENPRYPPLLDLKASLPDGVMHAHAKIFTPTEDLTILVMQFVIDEAAAQTWEAPLRQEYQTVARSGRVTGYVSVYHQKSEAFEAARIALLERLTGWFGQNLPGAFSTNGQNSDWPTYELVSMKIETPFEGLKHDNRGNFFGLLGLRSAAKDSVWQAVQLPGIMLKLDRLGSTNLSYVLIGQECDLPFAEETMEDREVLDGFAKEFVESVDKTMALVALQAVGLTYRRRLSRMRDQAVRAKAGGHGAIRTLEFVRRELLTITGDAQRVGAGMVRVTEDPKSYAQVCAQGAIDFRKLTDGPTDRDGFLEGLRQEIGELGPAVRELEEQVRQANLLSSSLIGIIANLRLQARITFLTWVILGLTLLGVVAAFRDLVIR